MNLFENVRDFVKLFTPELISKTPTDLNDIKISKLRMDRLIEEINEYKVAVNKSDLVGQLDALVDIVYIALGNAVYQGFNFNEAFRRIHLSNLCKQSSGGDIIKPPGWQKPDLTDLVKKKKTGRIIILDGPDGSGKSTLAEAIANFEDNCVVYHNSFDELWDMGKYMKGFTDMILEQSKTKTVIVDRFIYSDLVYESVFREKRKLNHNRHENVIKKLLSHNLPIKWVMCLPSSGKRTIELCEASPHAQMYGCDKMDLVHNAFLGYSIIDRVNWIRYDRDQYQNNDIEKMVIKLLNE